MPNTKMINVQLYENETYSVIIGETDHSEKQFLCYKGINKDTGVVEFETSVLIQALRTADEYDRQLRSFNDDKIGSPVGELN